MVLDLGAGTGKLTRLFDGRVGTLLALEPAPNMLEKLRDVVPGALCVSGTAEAIPFPDASLDLALAGHAFHHFEWIPALHEVHRVLRPDGSLALAWARAAPDDPVEPAIGAIVDRHIPACPIHEAFDRWREAFRDGDLFQEIESRDFAHQQRVEAAHLAALMATSSDVASLPQARRQGLLEEIEGFARRLPQSLSIPRITEIHLFRRMD